MVVVPSTIATLSQYADQLLSVCEDAVALTDAGVQERVYVSASEPAFDCEQLTCYVSNIAEAITSPFSPTEVTALRTKFGNVIMVTYVIDSVRCSTTMPNISTFPSVASLNAVAHTVLDDMFALWNGLRHAHENGEIFDQCLGVHFDGIVPLPDMGDYVGCEMTVSASIPGIARA